MSADRSSPPSVQTSKMGESSDTSSEEEAVPTPEELERENKRLRKLIKSITRQKEEERRLKEEERRQKEEERRLKEEERRQKEEERRLKEEERRQKEEERRLKEEEQQQKEEERRQKEELQKLQSPTRFLDYLSLVDEHLFTSLAVERDPHKSSTPGTTDVGGRVYPQHFRPWTDFSAAHAAVFAQLAATFGNDATFPSRNAMQALGENISPKVSDEADLRPFLRSAVEKPAELIVTRYLQVTQHDTLKAFKFRSNSYGVNLRGLGLEADGGGGVVTGTPGVGEVGSAPEEVSGAQGALDASTRASTSSKRPKKRQTSPIKEIGSPDRWGFAIHRSEKEVSTHVVVGEYKAAHKLRATKLRAVLSQPPSDDFFVVAARDDAVTTDRRNEDTNEDTVADTATLPTSSTTTPAATARTGRVYVARVLCQAYHYMITSGLEYGYVASGEGLVLLRVREDDANTLYYFWQVFTPASGGGGGDGGDAPPPARQPQDTPAGYLAGLAMMGLRSKKRPEPWIIAREKELRRWPQSPRKALEDLPRLAFRRKDGGGGSDGGPPDHHQGGGSGTGNQTGSRNRSHRKRGRDPDPEETGDTSSAGHSSTRAASGPLPFCTQACLLGIARRLPLDRRCPNVHLHRAARKRQRQAGGQRDDETDQPDDGHALTEQELREHLIEQAKTDGAVNMRSLEQLGLFGRFGVLVRVTVAGFGYTFVGKGIMCVFRGVLDHELAVYEALSAQQGRLIPVCLGKISLPEEFFPGPRCTQLSQLLLLSFAGPDLSHYEALPYRVDVQGEMDRTTRELEALGLYNDDIRICNCAWNKEAQRVMHFDFDQAYLASSRSSTPELSQPSEPTTPNREPSRPSTPEPPNPPEVSHPPELPEAEPAKPVVLCKTPEPPEANTAPQHASQQQGSPPQTRSPLLAKRDWNQFHGGSSPDGNAAHTKQRRRDSFLVDEPLAFP
ncbi:metalloprotease m41 [Niveomyces insectorum RCEF 264]|uniref:Metalloprotease m41 n=1 Tax=Niveomyces insectorum RCEF 264 TaxID=1081102 RepID=A0A167NIW8_9HYPO|nr:metalloprotease m41 [Niveomyces insectorum RCEF 264]